MPSRTLEESTATASARILEEMKELAEQKAYLEQLEIFLALQEEECKLAELMAGMVLDRDGPTPMYHDSSNCTSAKS